MDEKEKARLAARARHQSVDAVGKGDFSSFAAMDIFDHRFLREFLFVAREGSVRKASDRLNIAPSAISQRISEHEERLGIRLFSQHSQGMHLTDAGHILLGHANFLREEQAFVLDRLGQFREETRRIVRLAVGEGFAPDLMKNGLPPLTSKYPEINYNMTVAGSDAIVKMVSLGQVDIGMAYNPILLSGTYSLAIGRQPLCAIVPRNSPLREIKHLKLSDVLTSSLAILNSNHAIYHLVARAASDRGLPLVPVIEADSISMMINFVTAGLGVTFLPRFSVLVPNARDELSALDTVEPALQTASAHLIVRDRARIPKTVGIVSRILQEHMTAFCS
ncbi:LysR family transcriptional regulator [Methylobacterium sp. WL64]|uniref:LysR family transcriptional regulator n=1 Tax=Methylobacterium sp. WL64 TaxID=2603894 RepID=UPI001AED74A0|nr:LysR family transcriptional regulator [Methylobacterium sp. WL64]